MAKTKTSKRAKSKQKSKTMANGTHETPEQLYSAALTLVEQSQPADALEKALKLWNQVQSRGISEALPALNLLGEISVELGDVDAAKSYFEQAVSLDSEGGVSVTVGGGAEKFLWLAQLCEEGGKQSVLWFEKGAAALETEIAALQSDPAPGMDEETRLVMRVEMKRKLANALCGIVEVYMTDLSWEEDAEARCENLITQAMAVEDETSAEVLQTLASVRLSQQRKEDAQAALCRSLDSWADLEPEDPAVPDFATRVSLARLLMEADMEQEAIAVLNRLVLEDDQSVEAWYLGGWCQHLLAERDKLNGASALAQNGDAGLTTDLCEDIRATMKGSRHWLQMSIKLYELLDYEDERLYEHAKELVAGLDMALGPENEQAEGGEEDEWEDEWEGIQDEEDDDEEMRDA